MVFRKVRLGTKAPEWLHYVIWTYVITEGIVSFIFRWFAGRDLFRPARERPTNATFLKRGTKTFDVRDRLSFWAYMPEWKRGLIRTISLFYIYYLIRGWLFNIAYARSIIYGITFGSVALLIRWFIISHRLRKLRKHYLVPLGCTIAPILNNDKHNVADWLTIPPELVGIPYFAWLQFIRTPSWIPTWKWYLRWKESHKEKKGRPKAVIHYPNDLNVTMQIKEQILNNILDKFGNGRDWVVQWHSIGAYPYISIMAKPEPPELVTFSDIREAAYRAPEAAPIMGKSATGYVSANIDTDTPHLAVSCGSGAGKSELLKGWIAQWLKKGCLIIILDSKQISQHWCKDHPNVIYCRTPEEFTKNLVWMAEEVNRRFSRLRELPADQELSIVDVGQRIIMVWEEQNIGMQDIITDWRADGNKGRSPALVAYDRILCSGRAVKCHLVSIAQLFTIQACGGNPTAREVYGLRILARATFNAWMMLAPQAKPFPIAALGTKRGRMALALPDETVIFQSTLWSTKEARAWAFDYDNQDTPTVLTPRELEKPHSVTLAEAAKQKIVPYAYGTLRNHSSRDSEFPNAVNGKYRIEDLQRWHKEREQTKSKVKDAV